MPVDVSSIWDNPEGVRLFSEEEVVELLDDSLKRLRKESNLMRIDRGKTLFVGDTHGNFMVTKAAMKIFKDGDFDGIVFMGDYVDRGSQQLDNVNCIMGLKLAKPEGVFLLRGNHEALSTNFRYGFWESVTCKYSESLYKLYNHVFSYLPLAAITWDGVFVVHGGIAKGLESVDQIDGLPRGEIEPNDDIVPQLLWNDPAEWVDDFAFNDQRGGFYYYGRDVFLKFLDENGLRMMLRSHEVFPEGYRYFFNRKLLSIFSSTGYCGASIKGKAVQISEDGEVELVNIEI